jgi:hypothetical protein
MVLLATSQPLARGEDCHDRMESSRKPHELPSSKIEANRDLEWPARGREWDLDDCRSLGVH